MRTVTSTSAARRLAAARAFLAAHTSSDIAIVAASRGAADDLARVVAHEAGATFGVHRFSLTQIAARLAAPVLAGERRSPTSALGVQAVAARALYDATEERGLRYFGPVAAMPGFSRALARTLEELALSMSSTAALSALGNGGRDLAELYDRFDAYFQAASAVDRAGFLRAATEAARHWRAPFTVLFLDMPIANVAEERFVEALVTSSTDAFATVAEGDAATLEGFARLGPIDSLDEGEPVGLDRIGRYLFAEAPPPPGAPLGVVELFSAPGEGREAVEIARRILREARRGVPFDRMAIAIRTPQHYAGLLEQALRRASIPAYFERGTRRPHPAGRAFLALLACALDNLSARRFAEYLSLGQVPEGSPGTADTFPAPDDEVFGVIAERSPREPDDGDGAPAGAPERPFRAPWRWERLLAESRIVSSEDRWARRLDGLANECTLQRREIARTEPDSPRLEQLDRKVDDIRRLAAFALPVIRTLASWPAQATWAEWLNEFDKLAPRVLRHPDRVMRVHADLRPMSDIGHVSLAEAARVLTDRLANVEADPPARRYGRVLIGTPFHLRGRAFEVVFVPALAERMFPQKPREDPLLLDETRQRLDARLRTQVDRADEEKLQLRLAVGAATTRLYVSFPTVDIAEGRPRVPSLYALEVWRAMTGRVPGGDELLQTAAHVSQTSLAWPAPADRNEAIDALEHDLATLRALAGEPDHRVRGRAQYILRLNDCLQRSVRERFMRARTSWSHWDGITAASDRSTPLLDRHRLTARVYSLSALQKYSVCPYQFLLGAMYRMRPAEDLEPLHRMDPLTRGSLFHEVQAAFYRDMASQRMLPLTHENQDVALATLDRVVTRVADEYHEYLAPAVDRIWHDEIAAIRRDLRLWIDELARAGGEWVPRYFEWAFGIRDGGPLAVGRDPSSVSDPVTIDHRFQLHGSIDLVEEHATSGQWRVTDHKTGRYRGKPHMIVDGGAALQPVLYSLAFEAATGHIVAEGRLYYATTAGGFQDARIPLSPQARRSGVEVLEIIDRAIQAGFLAPAPREHACTWCDFRPVCGPNAARRAARKSPEPLADLLALRKTP